MALIINVEKGDINLDAEEVLDLTEKGLKKLEKCGNGNVRCLLLDNNDLARLENVESYGDLLKLSVTNNKLVRMYGVCRLIHLRILNLANNSIVAIEGMRELVHLTWLRLSGNKIKLIEHLGSNGALEYLDLSNNCIASLANVNHLKVLHTLILDNNNIKSIHHAVNYFPATLTVLSLANNELTDLNQISYLCGLPNLENVSITNNPCIVMTGIEVGFDYRPFVINWCQNLKLLDGYMVGSKESLKAEWLYSMGKGRHYQAGEHAELAEYLSTVCPLTNAEDLVTEEDAKLSRILNKRRQHQQQLLQELSTSAPTSAASPAVQRRPATAPSTHRSASTTNLGPHGVVAAVTSAATSTASTTTGFAIERSASAMAVGAVSSSRMTASFSGTSSSAGSGGYISSAMTMSMSAAIHHKPATTTRQWPASKKKSSEGPSGKYADESSVNPYDLVGLMSRSYPGHYNGDDTTMFIVSPPDVPSDVPELCQEGDSDAESPVSGGGGALQFLLRSESQYVPVPETMLSPDFRPVAVGVSGGVGSIPTFEVASDAQPQQQHPQQQQPPTPEPDARPRWLQRSAIPRSTFAHSPPPPSPSTGSNSHHYHNQQQPQYDCEARVASAAAARVAQSCRSSATDSPILRRPTQVLRLQRTARPLSLSPSSGRRSPAVPTRSFVAPEQPTKQRQDRSNTTANATSSSDDDSTDSEVSVSKLALVREAAQTKMDAIVRRSLTSSMESSLEGQLTNETDSPTSSTTQRCQEIAPASTVAIPSAVTVDGIENVTDGNTPSSIWWSRCGEREGTSAAVKVQALWRGFRARRLDPRVVAARQEMRVRRAEDHVQHLTKELARARQDLDRERRLRDLQMEAIRALWVEVQNLQEANHDRDEPERATPCDSGHDSPGLSLALCPLEGHAITAGAAKTTTITTNGPAQLRRSGATATTTTSKSLTGTKTRLVAEQDVQSTDEPNSRSRTSPKEQCSSAAGRKGDTVTETVVTGSMLPERSHDENYNAIVGTLGVTNGTNTTTGVAASNRTEIQEELREVDTAAVLQDASSAEKMVHLTDTCSNLQTQVQQLQEALHTISCLLLGSQLQNRPLITPESLQASTILTKFCPAPPLPNATNASQSFTPSLGSPPSSDIRTVVKGSNSGSDTRADDSDIVNMSGTQITVETTAGTQMPLANGFYSQNGNRDEEFVTQLSPSSTTKTDVAATTPSKLSGIITTAVSPTTELKTRTSIVESRKSSGPDHQVVPLVSQ